MPSYASASASAVVPSGRLPIVIGSGTPQAMAIALTEVEQVTWQAQQRVAVASTAASKGAGLRPAVTEALRRR